MRVTNSRRLPKDGQVIRRRRVCGCGASFQTEERPRLWITEDGRREPFLRGALLASLRRATRGAEEQTADEQLQHVVHQVVAKLLAENQLEASRQTVRARTGDVLLAEGLDAVAFRYEPALDPGTFLIEKHGGREPEPFDRDKLRRSIVAAASKFLADQDVNNIVEQIETDLGGTSGQATAQGLRMLVSMALRERDERAFLRYALGARHGEGSLESFLERVAPTAQVRKRDGTVVLFDGAKLGKSIRRSFVADDRDARAEEIASFVEAEQTRVREKLATEKEPETTANIGKRALVWLFVRDELAWANYCLAFERDDKVPNSPVQHLLAAQARMRKLMTSSKSPGAGLNS